MAKRGRGRPPGESGTREAILTEARRQFGDVGYRSTTLRSIARGAGVDARLLLHYFGSKQELFAESVELPIPPERVIAIVFADGDEHAPRNAARLLVSILEDPTSRRSLTAMLRAAVSEPEAASFIGDALTRRMLMPIASRLGGDHAELRSSLVAAQLVGLTVVRHVVGMRALAEASSEELVRVLEPVFEHYFHEDWASGR